MRGCSPPATTTSTSAPVDAGRVEDELEALVRGDEAEAQRRRSRLPLEAEARPAGAPVDRRTASRCRGGSTVASGNERRGTAPRGRWSPLPRVAIARLHRGDADGAATAAGADPVQAGVAAVDRRPDRPPGAASSPADAPRRSAKGRARETARQRRRAAVQEQLPLQVHDAGRRARGPRARPRAAHRGPSRRRGGRRPARRRSAAGSPSSPAATTVHATPCSASAWARFAVYEATPLWPP